MGPKLPFGVREDLNPTALSSRCLGEKPLPAMGGGPNRDTLLRRVSRSWAASLPLSWPGHRFSSEEDRFSSRKRSVLLGGRRLRGTLPDRSFKEVSQGGGYVYLQQAPNMPPLPEEWWGD